MMETLKGKYVHGCRKSDNGVRGRHMGNEESAAEDVGRDINEVVEMDV